LLKSPASSAARHQRRRLFGVIGLLATGTRRRSSRRRLLELYLGGVFGFIIIGGRPRLPEARRAYAIALMVCGQCLAALIIDHYGLMGMEKGPITLQR
jgi:uncharacterized membrane protein YdcZ (DUF606 family)